MLPAQSKGQPRDVPREQTPPIHRSHWGWLVISYFFLGGVSGGAQVVASVSELGGGTSSADVTRLARFVSIAAFLPCPPLLILDLGRPERFLHMLRVVKLRSPMSVGTWVLVAFGGVAALGALDQAIEDGLPPGSFARRGQRRQSTAIAIAGLPLGLLLAGYTGVLLAATAVPLWAKRPLLLGPLFLASALSTASAAVDLLRFAVREEAAGSGELHRFKRITALTESLLLALWLARLGRSGQPLATGALAPWVHLGVAGAGLALPSVLDVVEPHLPPPAKPAARVLASVSTLLGGFVLRSVVVIGGNRSADDAGATFDLAAHAGGTD